jgi:hypothetical protein
MVHIFDMLGEPRNQLYLFLGASAGARKLIDVHLTGKLVSCFDVF